MEKVLVAHVVAPDKVSADTFRFADREWRRIPWRTVIREQQARPRSEAEAAKRLKRLVGREAAQAEKRRALGIDFGGRLLLAPLLLTQPVALAPRVSKAVLARRARTGAGGGERGGAAASVGCSNECEAHEDQQPGHFGVNDGQTDTRTDSSRFPLPPSDSPSLLRRCGK
jgi:hypothetical protein